MHIKFGDPLPLFMPKISYHESKVEKGQAEILADTTFEKGAQAKSDYMESIIELNPRVRANKGFDISVAFHPTEKLSNEEMKVLAGETINGLGYANCPFVVYRHYDKPHSHFHIVVTSVDMDGKKITEFNNHKKAKDLAIHLEKKYALRHTERAEKGVAHKDYLVEHYSIAKAAVSHGKVPGEGLSVNELKDKSNKHIKAEYGDEVHNYLEKYYAGKGLIDSSERQKIEKVLREYQRKAASLYGFENALRNDGFYVRRLKNGNYVYKLPEGQYYFTTSKQISQKFGAIQLDKHYKGASTQLTDKDPDKAFVKRISDRAMAQSKSMDEFVSFCLEKGIAVEFATYTNGNAYGVSFINIKTGSTYKGSQIGMTLSNLKGKYMPKLPKASKSNDFIPDLHLNKAKNIAKKVGYLLERTDREHRRD